MATFLTVVHIVVAIALIIIVLLQTGQSDMGTAFGGSSQSVFGSGGAGGFMTKLTAGAAVVFMATSVAIAYHTGSSSSIVHEQPKAVETAAPDAGDKTAPPPLAVPTEGEEKEKAEEPAGDASATPASEGAAPTDAGSEKAEKSGKAALPTEEKQPPPEPGEVP